MRIISISHTKIESDLYLYISEGYLEVEKQVLNVSIKVFWYAKSFTYFFYLILHFLKQSNAIFE